MTTRSSKRGTASSAAATTRVRGSLTRVVAAAQQTALIPLPPSAAGDLLALCDAQLLDAASCEEIYLHNATREASSGGEPPLMQVRRLDGQTPRAAPVAAASTTAAASHHRRR